MGDAVSLLMMTGIVLLLYFLPTVVAWQRHHRNTLAIFVLNLLLGWIVIGWIVAIIWACTDNVRPIMAR